MSLTVDRIVRSQRRTIALIVESDGSITVRSPLYMPENAIRGFVESHAKWVEKKQAELRATDPVPTQQYQAGENFLFLGRKYPLEFVLDQHQKLVLEEHFKLAESAREHAELVFQNWYRQQARRIIAERVRFFAEVYQLHYEKVKITSARTRWGSCSPSGTLSFAWRLILTPLEMVDYVVIHELAHTVHHNHSKRFWRLVEKLLPDYKERRERLQQYGQQVL